MPASRILPSILSITKGSVSTAMKHLKERGYVQEDLNRCPSNLPNRV